jgi:hypothetical protein
MSEFWYYTEGQETRGPITFDQLINHLSPMPSPRAVLVWREGLDQWTAAGNVREIAAELIRPPPLPDSTMNARNDGGLPVVTAMAQTDASRKDLEELRSDARAAADNVTAFMPRYLALQKAERDKVEAFAVSIYMENNMIREGLVGIDKRHAKAAAFSAKVMQVRTEFYRAYESYLAFLLGEYGKYNVVNGQVSFPRQPTVDRYNAVSSALNAAAKGVSDLEVKRKLLIQAQQQEWGRFVKEN